MVLKLVAAGVDIFRLNCCYRQPGQFEECIRNVAAASKAAKRKVGIMADLQGPQFRISDVFWTGVKMEEGWAITLKLAEDEQDVCMMGGSGVTITMPETVEHAALIAALVAVGETVILLHPLLPLVGVSIVMERERQQNDSLADGYRPTQGRRQAARARGGRRSHGYPAPSSPE